MQPPVFLADRAALGSDVVVLSGAEGRHAATTHSATRPAPSVTSARSPGRSLRTVAACRPSAPDRTTTSDASASRSARKTGGCTSAPTGRFSAR